MVSETEIAEDLAEQIRSMIPKRMTKREIKTLGNRIAKLSSKRLKAKLRKQLEKVYKEQIEYVANDMGVDIGFGQPDKNVIEVIMNDDKLGQALIRLNSVAARKASEIIEQGLAQARSLKEITDKLQQVATITETRADLIARTESQRVQTLARANSYEQVVDDGAKFKWIGPNDRRTTDICKKIRKRTRRGVSLERLKEIIKEESDETFYSTDSPYSPHWNCRHTFIRNK
jgi:SPP1 gp7 family putative phage head morphogenesis protein